MIPLVEFLFQLVGVLYVTLEFALICSQKKFYILFSWDLFWIYPWFVCRLFASWIEFWLAQNIHFPILYVEVWWWPGRWDLGLERERDRHTSFHGYSKQVSLVWKEITEWQFVWSPRRGTSHKYFLPSAGRTFPTHPYFSAQLGAGQLSLFNLLKAYSLLDKEVGYCQGISFVAGVLLLHMSEEQAFEMLKFLMYDLGFRKQYRPDMMSLQVRLQMLTRDAWSCYEKS